MTILHQPDLSAHVFDLACALNGVRAMPHRARMNPSPQTTETIADARQDHVIRFTSVLAALLYEEYHNTHLRTDLPSPPSFFGAPAEVQARFLRIAKIAIGVGDPDRESLAWHAASQRTDPTEAVRAFLQVLATASERPEVGR